MSNPIYSTSYDHDVKSVVLYADEDHYLYTDHECTIEALGKDVLDLCMKRLLVIVEVGGSTEVCVFPTLCAVNAVSDVNVAAWVESYNRGETTMYKSIECRQLD